MKHRKKLVPFYTITLATILCLSHLGSYAVTAISQSVSYEQKHCIIIDAGHGGEDGGATSCTGIPESEYNLEIALCLNDLFRLLGYDTKMIRTEDISVYTQGTTIAQKKISDLKERVRICNETQNGVLISIHQNIFSDNRYSGAQVFYADNEKSRALASQLQTVFVNVLNPGSNRQCKKADGIYLMEHVNCPALLIECGFLSNPQEEVLLRSKTYQQKLCCAIVTILSSYLSNT